jgi:DNA-directed RNA polymerase subunit RPC12/RpoP
MNKMNQYHCPDCGGRLKWMVTVGADESISSMSESLYHCENDNCGSDFNIRKDENGRFINMERYYFG